MLSLCCDWKLWLDKVTNKVLRSDCSSHLCWPHWVSCRVRTLLRFTDTSLGSERNRAEDNKKIAINGLFCLDCDESHIWVSSANQRTVPGSTASWGDQSEAGKLSPLSSDNNQTLSEKNGPNKIGTCQIKVICQSRTWWARDKKVYCFPQHVFFLRSIHQLERF